MSDLGDGLNTLFGFVESLAKTDAPAFTYEHQDEKTADCSFCLTRTAFVLRATRATRKVQLPVCPPCLKEIKEVIQ